MKHLLSKLSLFLVLLPAAVAGQEKKDFKPHPFAPSLPLLSEKEYTAIEKIIDQFILYDSGKLPQGNGKKILDDFDGLGPEAIPSLIEGLNQAANLQASCPAVIIARKLKILLNSSSDGKLLDYARNNVGIGVTIVRHMNSIKDLKLACMLRKSYLQQTGKLWTPPVKTIAKNVTTEELLQGATKAKGVELKQTLTELEQRQGEKVVVALADAVANPDKDIKLHAQGLLVKHLERLNPAGLKAMLKHDSEQVRAHAVYLIGAKKLAWGEELIERLEDNSVLVQQQARKVLTQLNNGKDLGPQPSASPTERALALEAWRHWWKNKTGATSQNK